MTRIGTAWLLAIAALSGSPGISRAALLPVTVTVTPDAGRFRWTYAIVLPTDSQIRSGDYFTIYDFGGLLPGSTSNPDGWMVTVDRLGPTPDLVHPNDDPAIENLSWLYTGPVIPTGQIGLGNFWAISAYGTQTDSFFTATTHRTSDGRVETNITETVVPVPTADPPPSVPEPGTLVLAAAGLSGLAVARSRRRTCG